MTLGIAISTGLATGLILRAPCFKGPTEAEDFFTDKFHFEGVVDDKEKPYKPIKNKSASSMQMDESMK